MNRKKSELNIFVKEFELSKAEKTVDVNKVKQEIESLSKEKSKLDAIISELRFVANMLRVSRFCFQLRWNVTPKFYLICIVKVSFLKHDFIVQRRIHAFNYFI